MLPLPTRDARRPERGQALVIVAIALHLVSWALTTFVVDGGNAFAQQRGTQNAADSAALAGATADGSATWPVR